MDEPRSDMTPEQKPPPGAEPVADYRRPPRGAFTQNAQRWLFLGISIAVVLTILLFGPEPPESTEEQKPAETPVATEPPSAEDDVDQRLAELERQIQDSMRAIPRRAPAPSPQQQSVVPPLDLPSSSGHELPDALADRMRELEYTSLFASSIALTYRADDNYRRSTGASLASLTPPQLPAEELYPPYAFAPRPVIGLPPQTLNPSQGAPSTPGGEPIAEPIAPPQGEALVQPPTPANPTPSQTAGRLYTIFEGSIIETALVNRLDSSFAGPIITMVTNDVYSHDRERVLIPAGTKCIGRTAAVESLGQTRMAVSFHRLIMPDGYSVSLDQFEGLNQLGDTGLKDKVNHHYFQIFGVSIALGFLGAISQREFEEPFDSAGPQFARSAAQIMDRFLNILPTVTIREGHRVKVYLTQDLKLPAYDTHAASRGL
jgi:type IV secretion system protein VirB10